MNEQRAKRKGPRVHRHHVFCPCALPFALCRAIEWFFAKVEGLP